MAREGSREKKERDEEREGKLGIIAALAAATIRISF